MKTDNELIAEFMGFDVYDDELFGNTIRVFSVKTDDTVERALKRHHVNQLKYTSSWDWLMPVVEKIEMLVTDPRNTEIGNSLSMWTSYHKVFNGTINTDIEVAYELIVEFIKWYNNQKPVI